MGREHAKPVALKILRMTSRKAEKLIKKALPTPGPLIDPPDWLTAEQKDEWKYAIEHAPRDVLRKIDKSVMAGFIVAADTHRQASAELAKTQLLVKSPKQGLPQQNPYLPIVNRQMLLMIRAAGELGFTPCSRARIEAGRVPESTDVNHWEDVG